MRTGREQKEKERMDLDKVIAFLKEKEAGEDVIKFVSGLKPVTAETVKDYLENTDDGKKLATSLTDAKVTKGIETFKTNNLQKILDDEIAKRFPPETEEAKKLRELEKRINDQQAEIKKKDLLTAAIKKATEKGLPVSLIDRFLGDDEETTEKNLSAFEEELRKAVETQVELKFKASGREPGAGSPTPPAPREGSSELVKELQKLV